MRRLRIEENRLEHEIFSLPLRNDVSRFVEILSIGEKIDICVRLNGEK